MGASTRRFSEPVSGSSNRCFNHFDDIFKALLMRVLCNEHLGNI
jgi:hypothetical protein